MNKERFGYVYLSTCLVDNMLYVGKHARSYFDTNYYGTGINQRKWLAKYGKENFKIEILQWCYSDKELSDAEEYWEAYYRKIYGDVRMLNIATGGISGDKFIHNPNHKKYREKLRDAIYRQNRNGENHPFYGKHHTDEAKAKIAIAQEGKTMSNEAKRKISESKMGHEVDEDTRKKISDTLSGRKLDEQHRKNITNGLIKSYKENPTRIEKLKQLKGEKNPFYGKHHNDKSKKKLSNSRKEYFRKLNVQFDNILALLIEDMPEVKDYKISVKVRLIMQIAEELKKQNLNKTYLNQE